MSEIEQPRPNAQNGVDCLECQRVSEPALPGRQPTNASKTLGENSGRRRAETTLGGLEHAARSRGNAALFQVGLEVPSSRNASDVPASNACGCLPESEIASSTKRAFLGSRANVDSAAFIIT